MSAAMCRIIHGWTHKLLSKGEEVALGLDFTPSKRNMHSWGSAGFGPNVKDDEELSLRSLRYDYGHLGRCSATLV